MAHLDMTLLTLTNTTQCIIGMHTILYHLRRHRKLSPLLKNCIETNVTRKHFSPETFHPRSRAWQNISPCMDGWMYTCMLAYTDIQTQTQTCTCKNTHIYQHQSKTSRSKYIKYWLQDTTRVEKPLQINMKYKAKGKPSSIGKDR